MSGPSDHNPTTRTDLIASYRLMIHRRNAARTDLAWRQYEAVAKKLRDQWYEAHGENTLHRTTFGKLDDGQPPTTDSPSATR